MLKRDQDDPRLPAYTKGEWIVEGKTKTKTGAELFFVGASDAGRGTITPLGAVGQTRHLAPGEAEAVAHLFAAAPDLLGCVFGLLVNFPLLGTDHEFPTEAAMADYACNIVEWLQEQAPYWRDALAKAGVEL